MLKSLLTQVERTFVSFRDSLEESQEDDDQTKRYQMYMKDLDGRAGTELAVKYSLSLGRIEAKEKDIEENLVTLHKRVKKTNKVVQKTAKDCNTLERNFLELIQMTELLQQMASEIGMKVISQDLPESHYLMIETLAKDVKTIESKIEGSSGAVH